ncbi:glycosyltransferase [Natrarchaeobaculum aegyptiacum]|uniref:Glycosyl transferase n=1 Tax=Natrarchaeobaculum aegyptiacum TaxID=745377 RepID=A0A2Z2I027_9EURY|nr:glycosyltransferase [Natrarchaeobaculum aegyptiacum]ARS91697.1 glycosyl transferase [Natrarchaeobaculum aegyptiacum]
MNVLTLTTYADAPFMRSQLEALADRGVSSRLMTVPGHVSAGESRGVRDYLAFFPAVRREIRRGTDPAMEENAYDLVHAHYGLTAPMALAQRQLPVVCSLWGTDLEGPGGPVSRACAPFCEEVVVMTDEMARSLGTDCTVLPFGIDLDVFRPMDRDDARERVGWDPDVRHVLFPYPPERTVKNYPRATRLVSVVDNLFDDPVQLQVVHDADHHEVPTYMNAADALLLTSDHEGSPTAVKEALACNLPVVATDVGDVSQRLAGVSPSTVAADDDQLVAGLLEVLEREERSNGREAVREVSQDVIVDRLLECYQRAVDR